MANAGPETYGPAANRAAVICSSYFNPVQATLISPHGNFSGTAIHRSKLSVSEILMLAVIRPDVISHGRISWTL